MERGRTDRSLEAEAILEPAQREAKESGYESAWELVSAPLEQKLTDGTIALVALKAFARGASVVSLRQVEQHYCVAGAWFYSFGGAGVDIEAKAQKVEGGHAVYATYGLTEGWSMGGVNTWRCKLVTFSADLNSLSERHTTPDEECPPEHTPVRLERFKGKLWLHQGDVSFAVEE